MPATTKATKKIKTTTTILKSKVLDEELESLEGKTGYSTGFAILWTPKVNSAKEGEVKFAEKTICIYSTNLNDALDTLRHEFFEILIYHAQKPHVDLIKVLFHIISTQAYENKEEMIECLVSLVSSSPSSSSLPSSSDKEPIT